MKVPRSAFPVSSITFVFCFLVFTAYVQAQSTTPSKFDGPAELPREYVKSMLADTPAPGHKIAVKEGDSLQSALDRAACGDTIELQAGGTFGGDFRLPAIKCDDAHWIVIRTSAPDNQLPPEGTRISPCYAGVASLPGRPFQCSGPPTKVMAKVVYTGKVSGPFTFLDGANHYRFIGLEVTRDAPGLVIYNLASPDKGAAADHLVFDRVWMHGVTQDETTRGIALGGSKYVAVVDSFFSDFHCTAISGACTDSQAIAGGNGTLPMGPYKIVNNFLEAAGESILFGGGPATATPSDIEVRHNYMFKPLNWMPGNAQFMGAANGRPFIVKNLFELKNAQRVLFEGNILENTWGGFTQTGFGLLLTPKNQTGNNNQAVCPDCVVTDVTVRLSRISHVGSGLQVGNGISDAGGASKAGERYSIHDIVVDDIIGKAVRGFGAFAQVSMAKPTLHDVKMDHITAFPPDAVFIMGGPTNENKMFHFSFTNSILSAGENQIVGTGGGPQNCSYQYKLKGAEGMLKDCFADFTVQHNIIVDGSGWPKGNTTVKKAEDVGFVNFNGGKGGDYHLGPKSRFKGTGGDNKDPGADIDAVNAATAGVQ